jgi:hypothetical protein
MPTNARICNAVLLKKGTKCSFKAKDGSDKCGHHLKFVVSPEISKDCSICLETVQRDFVRTPCNHYYHKKCLNTWKQRSNKCPCCRRLLGGGQVIIRQGLYNAEEREPQLRDMAIRLSMRAIQVMRDNSVVGSAEYTKYNRMMDIRRYEDLMNSTY